MRLEAEKLNSVLSLRQRIPKGEYLEEFLKEKNLWEEFRTSGVRRRYSNETQALEIFVEDRGLKEEFRSFRNSRLVGIRLSGRAVNLE